MTDTYNPEEYKPTIDAILSVSDLDKVSVKRIRRAIQELFAVDLDPHREDINEIILARYHKFVDEKNNDDRTEKQRKRDMERSDALLALKLSKQGTRNIRANHKNLPKPKKRKSAVDNGGEKKKRKQTLFILSPICQEIVGVEATSRPQVVKKLWEYIKGNKLQSESDGRIINCDDKLERLFKRKQVNAFSMNKYLSDHLTRDDDNIIVREAMERIARENELEEQAAKNGTNGTTNINSVDSSSSQTHNSTNNENVSSENSISDQDSDQKSNEQSDDQSDQQSEEE